jgi:dihydrofolate synthase/folylpolyglutamate synthase
MTYPEAVIFLGQTRRFGMKLRLEPMRQTARALGNPQEKLRFIHLAGTNGKGSTAAFCESCLRAAGYRVGLYTSPHLVTVRERIQIDRVPISEDDFAGGMEIVREALARSEEPASTFFEIMTALALGYFAREKVDWVVWETGLGGRLDATNIVRPEVSIITNIGLDHQQYLGQTLREIAAEKAGIIKPGVPVISGVKDGEAGDVIDETARANGSRLLRISGEVEDLGLRDGRQVARLGKEIFSLGLIGAHQVENAACAVAALRQLTGEGPTGRSAEAGPERILAALTRGLESTVWSGRFEILSESPLTILDGAHNPAGVRRLLETWNAFMLSRGFRDEALRQVHLVFASVTDKDITEIAELLRPIARQVSLVRLANERSADPAELAAFFPGVPCAAYASVGDWWKASRAAPIDVPILLTGSLFLVGEVLAESRHHRGEFLLNERLERLAEAR